MLLVPVTEKYISNIIVNTNIYMSFFFCGKIALNNIPIKIMVKRIMNKLSEIIFRVIEYILKTLSLKFTTLNHIIIHKFQSATEGYIYTHTYKLGLLKLFE